MRQVASLFHASAYSLLLVLWWAVIATITIDKAYGADLWDIYTLALIEDQTYRAAVFDHQATRLNLPLAKSAFKPSIISGVSAPHQDKTNGSGKVPVTGIGVELNLRLYDKPKRVSITQSRYQVEVSALQLRNAKQRLILRVANRYFDLLATQDAREVARLEKIAIRRQMELANDRLQAGLATETDLFDAKARFNLAKANEIRAQSQLNNSLAELKQIIDINPEALSVIDNSAPLQLPVPNDVTVWTAHANEHNIDIQIEMLNLEVALQEINKQRAGKSPTINLTGNASPTGGGRNTSSAVLELRLPLYLGGVVSLKTQQAGFNYNRRERLLLQTRRSASTKTNAAFLAVTSGISRVQALLDAVTAGESALQAKEHGFSAGLTTNLDVLDAQRDLSRSRTEYLRARYDYMIAVLELEMSIGQLDETAIKRVNGWLGN